MKRVLKGLNQNKKIKKEPIDYGKRIKQLNEINFPLDPKEIFENEIIDLMIKYKKKFNHLEIGRTNSDFKFSEKLVNYVNNIKRTNFAYLSNKMKSEMKKIGYKVK